MGWCSGTEIAEVVMNAFPKINGHGPYSSEIKKEVRVEFFKKFIEIMHEHDWDCESDMNEMDKDFLEAMLMIDPDFKEYADEYIKVT